ncbi:hypothetical protein SAICODRAFT_67460 [Saitoella complicata NRRL Y-17804]|uniref:uncharacterized protein n=1 Tax=Saitoella complicata (strain BCRC 22490 / CBS 7301 / JCM 7358 / NBRC 10748 / NRRL Y-17804) TaxID=698492 RepID=UPI0008675A6B|nr:uncharacterized protein SAICODRAFT_67460 [Saitoella complicata NRRL Y-17804]ODQ50635.1 hypothetical protein SAICODRAFT_67460 [Saitoella complicata NRRL Y-17804]
MTITHIVLFQFSSEALKDTANIQRICTAFQALKQNCLHPQTHKPYILSLTGGLNNSPEVHHSGGLTHGWVVKFENQEDRDWYVERDPAHTEFKGMLEGVVEGVRVFDYEGGVF